MTRTRHTPNKLHRTPHSATIASWFKRNLWAYRKDIAAHGADAGYPHITYTHECCAIFDKYASEIWEMLAEDAEMLGENIGQMIGSFQRADMLATWDQFRNLMLWYAVERLARNAIGE